VRTSVQERVSMSSGRLTGLVGMGANDRMWVRYRRTHRPPGNINSSFGPNHRRQTSRIQPSVQISPNHFHPLHLRTSAPIRYDNDTAATAKQARCPRPLRREVGHGGGDGLFVRGGERLLGNRIGEGTHQGDALDAANITSNPCTLPLAEFAGASAFGASGRRATPPRPRYPLRLRLTLPREILMRPVRNPATVPDVVLRSTHRSANNSERRDRTRPRRGSRRSWPGVRAGYEMLSRSTTAQPT
jgi:hypothetical protein